MITTLYSFAPQDRSGKVRWLLKELEVDFDVKTLNGEENEHKQSHYTSVSPMGLVPAIIYEGQTIYESGAIAIFLTERVTSKRVLAPAVNSPHRAEFLKWVIFSTATLDPLLIKVFNTKGMSVAEKKNHRSQIYLEFKTTASVLEMILADGSFVVGNEFSAADIMLAQPLDWADKGGLLVNHPLLKAYLDNLKLRQACIDSAIFQS